MITLPELKRLTIQGLNFSLEIQTISLKPQKPLNSLTFQHRASSATFADLNIETISSSLYGLVYELPTIQACTNTFEDLENLLKSSNNEYGVGILHEPISNFNSIFLMIHKSDSTILSSAFKSSKMAIFKLSYKKIFADCPENFIRYLIELNVFTETLYNINCAVREERLKIGTEIQRINGKIFELHEKNGKVNKNIVTARNSIRKLAEDTKISGEGHVLDCVSCNIGRKNVLFLPCGHCVLCKMCTVSSQKIPLNTKFKKSRFRCSVCRKGIEEAVEVFFD